MLNKPSQEKFDSPLKFPHLFLMDSWLCFKYYFRLRLLKTLPSLNPILLLNYYSFLSLFIPPPQQIL